MSVTNLHSKIVNEDGVVYFTHSLGFVVPLTNLAFDCGYRIDKICERLEISPRHFRRLFDTCLGICPKKWIKSQRMVLARNLLRSGMSIKHASDELGFAAQKEFHREFREFYEVAPSEYRAQQAERVMQELDS